MEKEQTRAELEAEYWRLLGWRDRWAGLANDRVRMRKMGGLQRQMDYVIERAQRANRAVSKILRQIASGNFKETSPPFTQCWHHDNGVLACGTIRIAKADFDTSHSQQFKDEMFDWMCSALNKAAVDAQAKTADPIEHEEISDVASRC